MNHHFLQEWCKVNHRLDEARTYLMHPMLPIFVKGAAPAGSRRRHNTFVAKHTENWDLMSAAQSVRYIDDPVRLATGEDVTCQDFDLWCRKVAAKASDHVEHAVEADSPGTVLPALADSGVPLLLISGWSCITVTTAVNAFATHSRPDWRLLVGPWTHGGMVHYRYSKGSREKRFPFFTEIVDFFLHHMTPSVAEVTDKPPEQVAPAAAQPAVDFYVCGSEPGWHHCTVWPHPNVAKRPLWLAPGRRMAWARPSPRAETEAAEQLAVSSPMPKPTGIEHFLWEGKSRYRGMIKIMEGIEYKWRDPCPAAKGQVLLFETEPLEEPLAIVGSIVLCLSLRSASAGQPSPDADIFAYLCERPANGGSLVYITEGMLRLSHRKEVPAPHYSIAAEPPPEKAFQDLATEIGCNEPRHTFERASSCPLPEDHDSSFKARLSLLPAGYRFHQGSRLALVLASDDVAHFALNPDATGEPPQICHSDVEQSLLWLPVFGSDSADS